MSNIVRKTYSRLGRRPALALAAGSAAVAAVALGGGVAFAAVSPGPAAAPAKIVGGQHRGAAGSVTGTSVTLGPNGYASGTVTCPAGTEVFGGGESNTAPGVLVLTDSWPSSNTSWLVYVKNNSTGTYQFTPYAVCR